MYPRRAISIRCLVPFSYTEGSNWTNANRPFGADDPPNTPDHVKVPNKMVFGNFKPPRQRFGYRARQPVALPLPPQYRGI